jgi:hypothetical protein
MPRKKKDQGAISVAQSAAATATAPDTSIDTGHASRDETAITPTPAEADADIKLIRPNFTSSLSGVRAGEDLRFQHRQSYVAFDDDRPATTEEKAELSDKGFRYRVKDKGYSTLATPEKRDAALDMAERFKERRLKESNSQER